MIVAIIGSIGTGIAGVLAVKGKSVDQGPEWYKTLSARVDTLDDEVQKLRSEVRGLQAWKWSALRFIRTLLDLIDPALRPAVPTELREDLDPHD